MIKFLQSKLSISFRTRLTRYCHDLYLSENATFYKVVNLDSRIGGSGADQFLTTDLNRFCETLSALYSNVSKPTLDLLFFNYQLGRSIGGKGSLGLFASYVVTALVLRKITPAFGKLAAIEARLEGDFRQAHARVIINAEEIAFYDGAQTEKGILDRAYLRLIKVCFSSSFPTLLSLLSPFLECSTSTRSTRSGSLSPWCVFLFVFLPASLLTYPSPLLPPSLGRGYDRQVSLERGRVCPHLPACLLSQVSGGHRRWGFEQGSGGADGRAFDLATYRECVPLLLPYPLLLFDALWQARRVPLAHHPSLPPFLLLIFYTLHRLYPSRTDYISNRRLLLSLADAGGRLMLSWKDLSALAGSTSRVYTLLSTLHDMSIPSYTPVARPDDLALDAPFYDLGSINGKLVEDAPATEGVSFDKVPVVAPAPGVARGGEELIKGLKLQVKPGEHLLITGGNGSGKTAIARVLAGSSPSSYPPNHIS
jgi:ABC-type uncharacterized transport system fused permease/ATPase subunit